MRWRTRGFSRHPSDVLKERDDSRYRSSSVGIRAHSAPAERHTQGFPRGRSWATCHSHSTESHSTTDKTYLIAHGLGPGSTMIIGRRRYEALSSMCTGDDLH